MRTDNNKIHVTNLGEYNFSQKFFLIPSRMTVDMTAVLRNRIIGHGIGTKMRVRVVEVGSYTYARTLTQTSRIKTIIAEK